MLISTGLFKVAGDAAQMMSPLLVKALIRFSQEGTPEDWYLADRIVYRAEQDGTPKPNIGRGIGMAIGLWALVVFQSICQHQVRRAQRLMTDHQFFFRSMAIGVLVRATLISAVYKRALSLTVEARASHPNGQLTTLVSSDVGVTYEDLGTD